MSQADLARRMGVTAEAASKLEHAEVRGGITIAKLSQVARSLDCSLFYAIVPNSSLEQTVLTQSRAEAQRLLNYAAHTMALEDQRIDNERQREAVEILAHEIATSGSLWKTTRPKKS